MTDTLSRSARRRLLFVLTTAILVAGPARSPAWAEESLQRAYVRSESGSASSLRVADAAVDDVFASRWGGLANQHASGRGGNRPPSEGTVKGYADLQAPEYLAPASHSEYSQFDILSTSPLTDEARPCGISPVSAAEIARLVMAAAQKYDVDPDFALAIATAESRLDRFRNSPKGARGPMQLMPATADRLGVKDICDPADNIDGGVRFLKDLFDAYRNPLIVAAAYNAGETTVEQYGGIPPFPETLNFVAEVLNQQLGLQDAEAEGGARSAAVDQSPIDNAASGSIFSANRRQWVGGVMQF